MGDTYHTSQVGGKGRLVDKAVTFLLESDAGTRRYPTTINEKI
jgi:hypothetical protein